MIAKNGVADPDCYGCVGADHPYDPTVDRVGRTTRVASYTNLGNVTDQKVWLDSIGPITCGFDGYYDFFTWNGSTPYKKSPNATYDGGHVMLLVGYDDKLHCWIAHNLWGTTYGNGGYFLIAYGECNIDYYSKQGLEDVSLDPWSRRRLHNGCLIQSSDGFEYRNFELLRVGVPRVQHLWRDGQGAFAWHLAETLTDPNDASAGAGCTGMPALTSTTYNRNFETAYWENPNRLRYW